MVGGVLRRPNDVPGTEGSQLRARPAHCYSELVALLRLGGSVVVVRVGVVVVRPRSAVVALCGVLTLRLALRVRN